MSRTPKGPMTLVLALFLLLLLAAVSRAEVVDRIVAVVNDEVITMSEVEQISKSYAMQAGLTAKNPEAKTLQRQMLENLIDQKLARAEAKRRGIEAAPKDIDQALDQFKKRNHLPDDAALNKALEQANLTLAELRQQLGDKLTQQRLFFAAVGAKSPVVTDAEVKRFYEENVKGTGNEVHLRAIQIPYPPGATQTQKDDVQKKAEAIIKDGQGGIPFKELAQKHGVTETDMGFLSQSDLDPQLTEVLNQVKPGGVIPVENARGFQLIQVAERRAGHPPSLEDSAPEIREVLQQKDMERRFSEWVKTLRGSAVIKIML
jgi:peptidyl-prolyl cis-trans isomerase SurA